MTAVALLAAAASEAGPPLIDIDWTVLVQFSIFLAMMGVLYAFVFRPYLAVQDERGRRIGGARDQAKGMEERAAAVIADYEARLLKARQRGAEERLKLRAEGQAYEREVIERARAVGQKALDEARGRSAVQREAARTQLLAESEAIGRDIAGRVLGRSL